MSPEDVKALRAELRCSAHELAQALGTDAATVFAWESGERFPTKKHCTQMQALKAKGAEAFPRAPRKAPAKKSGEPLRDERFLTVLRKLVAHPELFEKVVELADGYEDPGRDG